MARGISTLSLLFCTTDEQAMLRVQAHDDHGAFAQLVSRWEEPIRRLCTRMASSLSYALVLATPSPRGSESVMR